MELCFGSRHLERFNEPKRQRRREEKNRGREEGEGEGREKWKEESNRTTYLDGQKQIDFLVTHVYRCGIQNVVGKYFMRVYY